MGALADRMAADMRLQNLRPATQLEYLRMCRELAAFHNRSPADLGEEDIRDFLVHVCDERRMSSSSIRVYISAFRFLYRYTLSRPEVMRAVRSPRVVQRVPEVLTPEEIEALLAAIVSPKIRTIAMTLYGAGLRIGEACRLQVGDVESASGTIRIRDGKGGKDRYTMLSPALLGALRGYWAAQRPPLPFLFPGRDGRGPINRATVQSAFVRARAAAGLGEHVTPHTLRHCFATSLLEQGVDLRTIQIMLGHNGMRTTERYLHVTRRYMASLRGPLDVLTAPRPGAGGGPD